MDIRRKAIVIHSPHSGRSEHLNAALAHLRDAGVEVVRNISIAELDNLPAQGLEWQQSGIDVAIAAGGDGVIGGVITHIAESGLPLGILPLGTANDIARSLNIPQDIRRAAQIIASGEIREADIGVARPAEQTPHLASKDQAHPSQAHVSTGKHGYFAHTVTIGLNVQFARIATNVATRTRYGRLTYPVAAIETLKYRDALDVTLQFTGLSIPAGRATTPDLHHASIEPYSLHCRALQVTVINAPIFGGRMGLSFPYVSINDHLLDIVVIEDIELGALNHALSHLFNMTGQQGMSANSDLHSTPRIHHPADLTNMPGIHHLQATGVLISTNADPRDVTLDGEVRGQTPMYVYVAEERLRVLAPAPGKSV